MITRGERREQRQQKQKRSMKLSGAGLRAPTFKPDEDVGHAPCGCLQYKGLVMHKFRCPGRDR